MIRSWRAPLWPRIPRKGFSLCSLTVGPGEPVARSPAGAALTHSPRPADAPEGHSRPQKAALYGQAAAGSWRRASSTAAGAANRLSFRDRSPPADSSPAVAGSVWWRAVDHKRQGPSPDRSASAERRTSSPPIPVAATPSITCGRLRHQSAPSAMTACGLQGLMRADLAADSRPPRGGGEKRDKAPPSSPSPVSTTARRCSVLPARVADRRLW